MRALEDALAIAQACESNQPHPLLATPWKIEDEEPEPEAEPEDVKPIIDHEQLLESFGTLHINEKEKTVRFFGPAGGAEVRRRLVLMNRFLTCTTEFIGGT